jgi:hypothetical protein
MAACKSGFAGARRARRLALAVGAVLLISRHGAAQTYWQTGTGSWLTQADWSEGSPTSSNNLTGYIENGGTAQVLSGAINADTLYLAATAGDSGNLAISGGTLTLQCIQVGYGGAGLVSQTGGTNSSLVINL